MAIFVGTAIALIAVALAAHGAAGASRRRVKGRAAVVRARWRGGQAAAPEAASVKRTVARGTFPGLDSLARRVVPRLSLLNLRLARTGRDIAAGTYLVVSGGLAAAAGGAAFLLGLSPAAAALAGLAAGVAVPHMVVGRMARRRIDRFTDIFPDALDLIVRGLRSGLPISETIATVGRDLADPVGHEFRLVADGVTLGRSLEDALWETATRLDTPEFKFFVIGLSIQRQTGGNLAETLANLSDILRRRRQMRLKIKAMSSEARASAYILGSLPFLMLGILLLVNFDYEMMLFTDPRGTTMVAAGLVCILMGIAVMYKMVKFEI
ncbi:MAG: type II secretion system F family protein [Rhodospirillales bacterium]|nr:type II secretion system F family protein [Rhodospirillales bacterium]